MLDKTHAKQRRAMLRFDEETRKLLDMAYLGSDFVRRRGISFDRLKPRPNDRILEIGCGNGLMTEELARAVGDFGQVVGIDLSAEMLASAKDRCAPFPQAKFKECGADSTGFGDAAFDKAVSVQVFEYIPDIDEAVRETHRVLRPGGKLVIGDMHFDTWAWHSEDPERMKRMMASWDLHMAHRNIATILSPILRSHGFEVEEVVAYPMVDTDLKPDGMAAMLILLMKAYTIENGHLPEADVLAWENEQRSLARERKFFHSMTHFVTVARKLDT